MLKIKIIVLKHKSAVELDYVDIKAFMRCSKNFFVTSLN